MIASIGKLTVAIPGTKVRVTSGELDPNESLQCHGVLFQALPTNTGKVYIGTAALNAGTLLGVLAILPIPTVNQLPTFSAALTISPNAIALQQLYIDADNADDGVLVTILQM